MKSLFIIYEIFLLLTRILPVELHSEFLEFRKAKQLFWNTVETQGILSYVKIY